MSAKWGQKTIFTPHKSKLVEIDHFKEVHMKQEYRDEIKALVDRCEDERDLYLIWLYVQHRATKHMKDE